MSRRNNKSINPIIRQKLADILYLHAELNRFYDKKKISFKKLLETRRILSKNKFPLSILFKYKKELRKVSEESRKSLGIHKTRLNREKELLLLHDNLFEAAKLNVNVKERHALLSIMAYIQYLDDLIDLKIDLKKSLSTYATCYYRQGAHSDRSKKHKRALCARYFNYLKEHPSNPERVILLTIGVALNSTIKLLSFKN